MDTAHRAAALAFSATPTNAPTDAPDFDIVLAAHKATRRFLFETLVQIGSLDVTDPDDIDCTLNLLDRLLDVLGEPRVGWQDAMHAMRHGAASQRRAVAAALYRGVADLVARHMRRLQQREDQGGIGSEMPMHESLAQLDDHELRDALHWMGGALTPQELATVLDEMHRVSSARRFHGALAVLSERMDARRWNQLARALGIAQITATAPTDPQLAAMAA